jgi:hypothetical protein
MSSRKPPTHTYTYTRFRLKNEIAVGFVDSLQRMSRIFIYFSFVCLYMGFGRL